ncbi:hypothetical protein ACFPTX_11160 [Pseudomonas sp. GCM10022188]|uniref:hypothetical protein n=1 Tax=Pseudomonas TaxID=286 RepID=UPI001E4C0BB3|nr:hypothetical protein [Pseudomonas oryzagri]MCC6074548.1 hypothetical protein [Pseudomonas oryzagri]
MRTTDFIKTSALALAAFTASTCFGEGYSESIEIPDTEWRVASQCTTDNQVTHCTISIRNEKKEEKVLEYPTPPTSASYESGVFLLTFSCGTACSATYAYKLGGQLGGPFPLVEAVDSKREVVMSLGEKSVRFYRMFNTTNKPLHEITPEIGGYGLLESIVGTGIEDHVFRVTYRGKMGLETLEYEAPASP